MEVAAKAAALTRVAELVRSFRRNEADYLLSGYNETQVRTDFITPLLEAFGWDAHNVAGHTTALREVIEEATVEVGEERLSKRPDYELRLARQRKLFVEAKKPSVRIDRHKESAFQTRRYGYSASLPIAVLTNFHQLAIYDCVPVPSEVDEAHTARILLIGYEEFEARFDELWPILSRFAVYAGDFDRRFSVGVTRHGAEQFDDYFLAQVRSWRERLAVDIHVRTPGLSKVELTYAVQLFLSRIVFLRICEDREIERYETLKNLPVANTFDALMAELRRADAFYDSGLFRLLDDARLGIRISDAVLHSIITELYYPQSPYTFAVVETEVLGEIYEQFLGEEITVTGGSVEIIRKPEIRESGGVVPTPRYIVDAIVERTLIPALAEKSPIDLEHFTVADICCGSGIFLLSVYEFILDHYLNWYQANNPADHIGQRIYDAGARRMRLTFDEKRRILLRHIRGVDIDANAIEVARFSLLLKLLEGETGPGLREYVKRHRIRALPDLTETFRAGNSLVSQPEWAAVMRRTMSPALIAKINPFDWSAEYVEEMRRGGFDVIVGNPPYIRIQNMTNYSPEEVEFYRNPASPYVTAHQDNFDKYTVFIERSLSLLTPSGRLGVITPHKFMTINAGRPLRRLVAERRILSQVVHFGVQQVFGLKNVANYTCILVLDRQGGDSVRIEKVGSLNAWRYGAPGTLTDVPVATLTEDAWQFANTETRALFDRVRAAFPVRLGHAAEIYVGVQTSADDIYIFRGIAESATHVTLRWNDRDWQIERGVLRPSLHDVQLFAYSRPQPNSWMIFPYDIVSMAGRTNAKLIQPVDMRRRFPLCLDYLAARRAELNERNIVGGKAADRQFYQFGRSQSLTKFNSPKIILPILSIEPRYTYDDSNIMVTGGGNGPYYMIRPKAGAAVTNYYLLAILNHPLSEAFVRTNTSTFRGGYYSHGKQFIEDLPIPQPSAEVLASVDALVDQLLNAHGAVNAARTPQEKIFLERQSADLRRQIEDRVTALFHLSASEMEVAREVPVPD